MSVRAIVTAFVRLTVCVLAIAPAIAAAQAYPSKPVRLIIPFPAGGPSDIFGRALAQQLSTILGQPVIVENRGGAGGVVGVDAAAKAPPDGYTLALNNVASVAMAPWAMAKMPYDPKKDLSLITTVVKVPEVLVVNPGVPAKNLTELVAYAKANPGKINHGSTGSGSITHLALELFKAEAKVDIVHVSYKGAAPAVTDLIGGQVQMGIYDVPVVLPHIKAGSLRALAVTSGQRSNALPDVPSTVEMKLPNVISDNWYGLVGPANLPADVVKRLNAAAVQALKTPQLVEQYNTVSGVPLPSTPEEYRTFLDSETTRWGNIIKSIGFKMD